MTNILAQRPAATTSSPAQTPAPPKHALTLPAIALSGAPALWSSAWLIMRINGHTGPGWGWTTAHLLWVGAYVLFGIASLTLFRASGGFARPSRFTVPAIAVALTGTIAFVGQMIVDLAVGFLASDKAEMGDLFDTVMGVPFVNVALYQVGPPLLFTGLLALVLAVAWRRQVAPWTAVATTAGIGAIVAGRVGPDSLGFVEGLGAFMLLVALTAIAGASKIRNDVDGR